jgi:hypothetical protein
MLLLVEVVADITEAGATATVGAGADMATAKDTVSVAGLSINVLLRWCLGDQSLSLGQHLMEKQQLSAMEVGVPTTFLAGIVVMTNPLLLSRHRLYNTPLLFLFYPQKQRNLHHRRHHHRQRGRGCPTFKACLGQKNS